MKIIKSVLFLLLFFLPVSVYAINCSSCRQVINGRYVTLQNGYICESCYVKSTGLRCAGCNRSIEGRYSSDGKNNYCSSCTGRIQGNSPQAAPNSPVVQKCGYCNSQITGRYGRTKDHSGREILCCSSCLEKQGHNIQFRCVQCNRTISGSNFKRERNEHGLDIYTCHDCLTGKSRDRYQYGMKCIACNSKIEGKYFTSPLSGRPACSECVEKSDKCKACSMPVTDNNYPDPQYPTCNECRKDAVVTKAQLDSIYARVRAIVKQYCSMEAPLTADRVIFADMASMRGSADKGWGKDGPPRDYSGEVAGLFSSKGDISQSTISIAKGMPVVNVYAVLAHEYGHACHYHYGKMDSRGALVFTEGFAEWVSYRALAAIGQTKYYYHRSKNKNSIYGDGFRKMLSLEKKIGAHGILNYMAANSDFPEDL